MSCNAKAWKSLGGTVGNSTGGYHLGALRQGAFDSHFPFQMPITLQIARNFQVQKKGSFGKRGLFQKIPFSRNSGEFRDSREHPDGGKQSLEILEILEIPVKRPLS